MAFSQANTAKYRLGPPTHIILDGHLSGAIDLGSTMGGVVFTYKQNHFKAIADQVLGPVADWRTEESGTVELSIPEVSVPRLLQAFGYPQPFAAITKSTDSTSQMASPTGATGSPVIWGGGATSTAAGYTYQIFAFNSNGDTAPSAAGATVSNSATLLPPQPTGSGYYNKLVLPALPTGSVGLGIIRTTTTGTGNSGTTGLVQRIYTTAQAGGTFGLNKDSSGSLVWYDYGNPADSTYTAVSATTSNPLLIPYDQGFVGGSFTAVPHQLDLIIPKSIQGTNLNWRWTFWNVVSDQNIVIDWKRDKNTEFKIMLECLQSLNPPLGSSLFRVVEEIGPAPDYAAVNQPNFAGQSGGGA